MAERWELQVSAAAEGHMRLAPAQIEVEAWRRIEVLVKNPFHPQHADPILAGQRR